MEINFAKNIEDICLISIQRVANKLNEPMMPVKPL